MSDCRKLPPGLVLARRIGKVLGVGLIGTAVAFFWRGIGQGHILALGQGLLFGSLGIAYLLPWSRLSRKAWRSCFGVLLVVTAVLAFSLIIGVMITFAEAARQGVRPGPPIFQGVVLFLVLMQPAVILFECKPGLLD